jgi:bifunctional non-homologous end joining protein LigD
MKSLLQMNQYTIPITNLDKIFWPDQGYTKGDLMQYYSEVWPYIGPHLYNRPVSLVRYPEGIQGTFFYQKDIAKPPAWVKTVTIDSGGHSINYAMINQLETLIWSINLGCIEVHPWLSTKSALETPTYIIFDLDPMEPAVFSDAVQIAMSIHILLKELSLESFPKISGATGIHIYLPISPEYTYQQTSNFVKQIGAIIIKTLPTLATSERKIVNRAGKVYIDYLQNSKGKTIASVYSVRPFPGAPVSIPVTWDELPDSHPSMFTIQNAPARLQKTGDLFKPLLSLKQKIPRIL